MSAGTTYSIDFHGLKPGTATDFVFGLGADFFARWPESEVAGVAPGGEVQVHLVRHTTMMELTVVIDARVLITCDRCLDEFLCPVHFEGHPVVKIASEIPEGEAYSGDAHRTENNSDGDVLWISPAESSLDLGQYIYESIMLSLPFQRVHPKLEECNQDMLKRFSIVSEAEFEEIARAEDQVQEGGETPFAALAALKDENK